MPNTTNVEKPTTPCPTWCKCRNCDGEHGYTPDRYTPASASLPLEVNAVHGAMFPAVGVSLFRDDIGAGPARIALHITGGERLDDQYDFTLEEGLQFAGDFLATYLMAMDDLPVAHGPLGNLNSCARPSTALRKPWVTLWIESSKRLTAWTTCAEAKQTHPVVDRPARPATFNLRGAVACSEIFRIGRKRTWTRPVGA